MFSNDHIAHPFTSVMLHITKHQIVTYFSLFHPNFHLFLPSPSYFNISTVVNRAKATLDINNDSFMLYSHVEHSAKFKENFPLLPVDAKEFLLMPQTSPNGLCLPMIKAMTGNADKRNSSSKWPYSWALVMLYWLRYALNKFDRIFARSWLSMPMPKRERQLQNTSSLISAIKVSQYLS